MVDVGRLLGPVVPGHRYRRRYFRLNPVAALMRDYLSPPGLFGLAFLAAGIGNFFDKTEGGWQFRTAEVACIVVGLVLLVFAIRRAVRRRRQGSLTDRNGLPHPKLF